jgi:hypothetical protein
MIPSNPGNLLPFYTASRWQRHRLTGQNTFPFGLTAPRNLLLPWQIWIDGGDIGGDTVVWELFSATDDLTSITLDTDLLTKTEKGDSSGYWITWDAAQNIDDVPVCGYWYIRLTVEGVQYFSEVLYLKDICGLDDCYLEIVDGSCSLAGDDLSFDVQATIIAGDGYTFELQKYLLGWQQLSTNELETITVDQYNELYDLRIQVITPCGRTMTRTYKAEWTAGDACNTLVLTFVSSQNNDAQAGDNPSWRLNMSNTTDKEGVLYQLGYKQHLYIIPAWDVPVIERNEEKVENGYGEETIRFSRTVERKRFEFADVPDYLLGFLTKTGDLDTITLQEVETGDTYTIERLSFDSRRQGPALNTGIITFEAEVEKFSGCQEDYVLA